MTQEVGTVEAVEGSLDVSRYPIGSFLKIIPYHVSVVIIVNRHNAALVFCFKIFSCKIRNTQP